MADLAKQLNEDAKLWRIVGLLHDLDYDAVKGGYGTRRCAAGKLMEKLPERRYTPLRP
jgi:predicted hydrolase (HD superfamily)